MPASAPTILATSMGFASRGRGPVRLAARARSSTSRSSSPGAPERPRLCYLGTATGDDPHGWPASTARSPAAPSQVSHLSLFPMPTVRRRAGAPARPGRRLGRRRQRRQPARRLAGARPRRDLPRGLGGRRRPRRGLGRLAVLARRRAPPTPSAPTCGRSPTASGSSRRPTASTTTPRSSAVRSTTGWSPRARCPAGHATDDGVGLVYRGTELVEAVADRPGRRGLPGRAGPRRHGGRDAPRAAPPRLTPAEAGARDGAARSCGPASSPTRRPGRCSASCTPPGSPARGPTRCCCSSTRRSTRRASAPCRTSGRSTAPRSSTSTAAARSPGTARASWSATRSSRCPTRSTSSPTSAGSRRR